jgi:ribose/xylose/arabinose/galactoside ABC-type transport system permease subunit
MYCSSCGVAIAEGLTYCNFCGARVAPAAAKSPEVRPELLVSAMVAAFVLGLAAIGFLAGILKGGLELPSGTVLGFVSFCLLILFGLEGVFITLLFRRRPRAKELPGEGYKAPQTNQLEAMPLPALAEPTSSVTDHTTRAFDRDYASRRQNS